MLHTQVKDLNFNSDIMEHEVQGCVSRNLSILLAIPTSWIKGFATPYKTHLAHIFVAISTLPQYARADEFITKTFEAVALSQCTRGPSGMKSLGGCISDNFKMGNIWIPKYLQMRKMFPACLLLYTDDTSHSGSFPHRKLFIRPTNSVQLGLSQKKFPFGLVFIKLFPFSV